MEEVKKILEKQLALLFKYSENLSDTDELCGISEVMVKVAGLLMGEQSRFSVVPELSHPFVVQLPVKDLIDLYAARGELYRRSS